MRRYKASFIFSAAAVAAIVTAPAAWADRDRGGNNRWNQHEPSSDVDYARVLNVEPLSRRVRISEPRRECYNETRYDNSRAERGGWSDLGRSASPAAGSMILGGVLGAAVGNQIGSGDGRRAATVAGALIGSALGHDAAARRAERDGRYADNRYSYRDDGYNDSPRAYTVERCDVRRDERWEERVDGYMVTYEYNGKRYRTRMPYDPGPQLRVRVDVRPEA